MSAALSKLSSSSGVHTLLWGVRECSTRAVSNPPVSTIAYILQQLRFPGARLILHHAFTHTLRLTLPYVTPSLTYIHKCSFLGQCSAQRARNCAQ